MNEYQLKNLKTYEESARRLRLIVDELNALDLGDVTEFEIQPVPEDYDFTPRYIAISALIMEGPIEIMCERDGYGNSGRWEFRCRSGICNTCKCTLVEGTVEYFEEPLETPDTGSVLICCSRPRSPLVIDV